MDKLILKITILLLILKSSSTQKCYSTENCVCEDEGQVKYLCPLDYAKNGGFHIILTKLKEVLIECEKLTDFDSHLLPNITLNKINLIHLKFCPLPSKGFKNFLSRLSVKNALIVQFEYGNLQHKTLTKNYFEKLENLEFLKLSKNGLKSLDEDLFTNTPNLIALELRNNNLTKLKANLFQKTLFLEWLDLADNQLDDLPLETFDKLKKLEYLRLWNNNIKKLYDYNFKNLVNLRSLELTANKIDNISENAFKNLKNLVNISLAMNNLTTISSQLFKNNLKLQSIDLRDNHNLNLPEEIFSNLFQLKQIDLSNCSLKILPQNLFKNCKNLTTLALKRNNLKNNFGNVLHNLHYLEELDLSNNQLETIDHIFSTNKKIKTLHLENNLIQILQKETFVDMIELEELYLQNNQITIISSKTFLNNDRLRIINLSHNKYSRSEDIFLKNTINIEEINLSHNLITQIEDILTIDNKPQLEKLDLSYNFIEKISLVTLQSISPNMEIYLNYNNISVVDCENVDLIAGPYVSTIYLENNPLRCNCHNYEFVKYLQSNDIKMFDIRIENLQCQFKVLMCPLEELIKGYYGCPKKCVCNWRPFDSSIVIDCSNRKLTRFPELEPEHFNGTNFKNIEVHLQNNSLINMNITGYENVTKLFLSNNLLTKLAKIPASIQELHLDHNNISRLNFEVLQSLNSSNLVNLTLDNNPWICDCLSTNLTKFIREHSKQVNSRDVYCINSPTTRLIELSQSELCKELIQIYLGLVMTFALVIAITTTIYYRYQKQIKFWLFSKKLCLWWVSEDDVDKDKDFDAFISYSNKDQIFVEGTLVPGLENYKLCMHLRDFIPGEYISTQIVTAIVSSKRTIVVLSKNFLESDWAIAEFRQARSTEIKERRVRIIMILFEEIDCEVLDEEIKMYLKTNTYVKWGDPYFWKKLEYALPHRKIKL